MPRAAQIVDPTNPAVVAGSAVLAEGTIAAPGGLGDQLEEELKGVQILTLEDYSIKVRLPGRDPITGNEDVVVHLRETTGGDLKAMESMTGGGVSQIIRMISRLCLTWGDLPGIEPAQIEKARGKHVKILGAAFARFLA